MYPVFCYIPHQRTALHRFALTTLPSFPRRRVLNKGTLSGASLLSKLPPRVTPDRPRVLTRDPRYSCFSFAVYSPSKAELFSHRSVQIGNSIAGHSGIFPCFLGGFLSRFVCSLSSAWISF